MTRQCFSCGREWISAHLPGRPDACEGCNTDLRCCRNCIHYDQIVAHQCRERRAEPVDEKDHNNSCEYFDFARRNYQNIERSEREISREDAAKEAMRKLLGD